MADWESILNMVVPAVITLERIAEDWFRSRKSGKQKKKFVHDSTVKLFKTAEQLTTGGAHHTVKVLEKNLPDLIDATAGVLFAAKEGKEDKKEEEPQKEADDDPF
jgi:gas vesicle protein